ncbi:hypothetical protein ACFFV7_39710 [Nonomuraea spiralis]|uniref:Uncharacterized protein n=1 Tax=Nonomuraea spiralis TaxID=46182 RepID=A0ABV5IS46_9ACTN|nr:hypothetical protein [Nonomuraea spiralis]GGT45024.1 hypothetical protein GCM10010176_105480 [Nonomuraea spiralis]
MPLNMPEPPGRIREETRSHLGLIARAVGEGPKLLGEVSPDDVEVSTPHRVFALLVKDIEADGGLQAARPVGWRFLLESGGNVLAGAEVAETPERTFPPTFYRSSSVGATATAVRAARALPQLEMAGFDLRLLQIPELYQTALWLHSPNTDLLIPLAPSPIGREGQVTPPPVFFRELTARAREYRAHQPSSRESA